MSNIFDIASKLAFGVVTTVFGYDATWTTYANPTITLEAVVGYGEPTEGQSYHVRSMIDDYNVYNFWMEYKLGDFEGLMESVRDGNEEVVTIFSDVYPLGRQFMIQEIKSVVDGRSFKAKLAPVV